MSRCSELTKSCWWALEQGPRPLCDAELLSHAFKQVTNYLGQDPKMHLSSLRGLLSVGALLGAPAALLACCLRQSRLPQGAMRVILSSAGSFQGPGS